MSTLPGWLTVIINKGRIRSENRVSASDTSRMGLPEAFDVLDLQKSKMKCDVKQSEILNVVKLNKI